MIYSIASFKNLLDILNDYFFSSSLPLKDVFVCYDESDKVLFEVEEVDGKLVPKELIIGEQYANEPPIFFVKDILEKLLVVWESHFDLGNKAEEVKEKLTSFLQEFEQALSIHFNSFFYILVRHRGKWLLVWFTTPDAIPFLTKLRDYINYGQAKTIQMDKAYAGFSTPADASYYTLLECFKEHEKSLPTEATPSNLIGLLASSYCLDPEDSEDSKDLEILFEGLYDFQTQDNK